MRRTRSTSTSDTLLPERRSARVTTKDTLHGNAKLKRNSLDLEIYARSSPRRKMVKLSPDTDYKPDSSTRKQGRKHFTRASKHKEPWKADKKCKVPMHDTMVTNRHTRAQRRLSVVINSGEISSEANNLTSADVTCISKAATPIQENGHVVCENGTSASSPLNFKIGNRIPERCRNSCAPEACCCNDRPVTRSAKHSAIIRRNSDAANHEYSAKVKGIDKLASKHCTSPNLNEIEVDINEQSSLANYPADKMASSSVETEDSRITKQKLSIEDLLEIEYNDVSDDSYVSFPVKRKMNLRSSGVQFDPDYYSLSLKLMKKSRSRSINSTSTDKSDHCKVSEKSRDEAIAYPAVVSSGGNDPLKTSMLANTSSEDRQPVTKEADWAEKHTVLNQDTSCNSNKERNESCTSPDTQHIETIKVADEISDNCLSETMELTNLCSPQGKSKSLKAHEVEQNAGIDLVSNLSTSNVHSTMNAMQESNHRVFEINDTPSTFANQLTLEDESLEKQVSTATGDNNCPEQQVSPTPKRKRGVFKPRTRDILLPERSKVKMLLRDPTEPPPLFLEEAVPKSDVYFFESDHVALKHNKDYQGFLKTVALLEAQRHQCLNDIESLREERSSALSRPVSYVDELQKQSSLSKSCHPQQVAVLPEINWQKYASQYGTFNNVFGNEATASNASLTKPVTRKVQLNFKKGFPVQSYSMTKEVSRTPNQAPRAIWTVEEQLQLEELLLKYPSEPVEFNRFRKIAAAMGNRTPLQVQSRVQKYFIKLAKAGLPILGARPRSGRLAPETSSNQRKRASAHPQQSYLRASTFFPQLHCPVQMQGDDDGSDTPSAPTGFTGAIGDDELASDDEDVPKELRNSKEYIELLRLKKLRKTKLYDLNSCSQQVLAQHVGYACDMCDSDPIQGVRYHCIDCPKETCVDLCQSCIHLHGQFVTISHKPSHRMEPVHESQNFMDDDYLKFVSNSGEYNYLDPNFHPASL